MEEFEVKDKRENKRHHHKIDFSDKVVEQNEEEKKSDDEGSEEDDVPFITAKQRKEQEWQMVTDKSKRTKFVNAFDNKSLLHLRTPIQIKQAYQEALYKPNKTESENYLVSEMKYRNR